MMKEPITVEDGKLNIPHLGITLRAMMGAAMQNHSSLTLMKSNLVPIYYKGVKVAIVRLGADFR